MNNEIQAMDVVESLKELIADLSYQVAYRDAVIKAKDREIEALKEKLVYKERLDEAKTAKVEAAKVEDIRYDVR